MSKIKNVILCLTICVMTGWVSACVARAEDYSVNFSYTEYSQERSEIYKIYKKEFSKTAHAREQMGLDTNRTNIGIAKFDLNEDGEKEIFVFYQSPYFCGASRCKLQVLRARDWNPLLDVYANDIVKIASYNSLGYRDILIGGGVTKNHLNLWRWNGNKYTPVDQ